MSRYTLLMGLLCLVVLPLYAQEWTKEDSLRLDRLLRQEGEIKLNSKALEELNQAMGNPKMVEEKPWLEVDETLPAVDGIRPRKIKMTLFPYTANTPYNWDPVRQRKIDVDENTWRGDPFYELKTLTVYSNWAKSPLDAGPRESLEQIEATGLRYAPIAQAGSHTVYGWSATGRPSGYSLMPEKGFWKVKARKLRARTLEVLRAYADSTRIEPKKSMRSTSALSFMEYASESVIKFIPALLFACSTAAGQLSKALIE